MKPKFSDAEYVAAAQRALRGLDTRLEVDIAVTREVTVSRAPGGAYVCCWFWVDTELLEELENES